MQNGVKTGETLLSAEGETTEIKPLEKPIKTFSHAYFKAAAKIFAQPKMIAFAAVICALRLAVKSFSVQIAPNVYLSFDCYINAIGSLVYGPLMALLVGAVSDTIGGIVFPKGAYFFPFVVVEMSSGFIFALFLWKKRLSAPRLLAAKFTVNFVCNIILNSLIQKWYYALFDADKVYYVINGVRIVKNLVLFPLEASLICILVNALLPGLKAINYVDKGQEGIAFNKKEIVLTIFLALLSIAIVLLYVFFLRDYVAAHNIKLF